MSQAFAPTLATIGVARKMLAAAKKHGTSESIVEYLPQVHPDQQVALVAYLVSMAATDAQRIRPTATQLAREEAAYTEADARRAHAAHWRGERDEWTVTGERIYWRRRQRAQRQARRQGGAA